MGKNRRSFQLFVTLANATQCAQHDEWSAYLEVLSLCGAEGETEGPQPGRDVMDGGGTPADGCEGVGRKKLGWGNNCWRKKSKKK